MQSRLKAVVRRVALMPMCVPLAFVVFDIVNAQPIHSPKGWSAEVIAGLAAFFLQFVVAVVNFDRLVAWQRRAAEFFAQPTTAIYVIATAALTAAAFAVETPLWAFAGVLASSMPLWLPNGSIWAVIFWIGVALPATFYAMLLSLIGLGLPLLCLAYSMWKSAAWHWASRKPSTEQTSSQAAVRYLGWAAAAAVAVAAAAGASTEALFLVFR